MIMNLYTKKKNKKKKKIKKQKKFIFCKKKVFFQLDSFLFFFLNHTHTYIFEN
jgi:hypothetical protein